MDCGGLDPDTFNLDASIEPDGRTFIDWLPCCQYHHEQLELCGWELVFDQTLEQTLADLFGWTDLRHVDLSDSLALFALRARVLLPHEQRQAFDLIAEHHRHHKPPAGWKFGLGCYNGAALVGVAIVGRPVSRLIQAAEPATLEITRVCAWGDSRLRRNACSKLYGLACVEAAKRGADKVITYTLIDEAGASCKAANFVAVAKTKGGSWSRKSRVRKDAAPTCKKIRWERRCA
jgi:hypothetical protein